MRFTCGGHCCPELVLQETPVLLALYPISVAPPPVIDPVGYAWPEPRIRPFSGCAFGFFLGFDHPSPFCPCRSGVDVSGNSWKNCLSPQGEFLPVPETSAQRREPGVSRGGAIGAPFWLPFGRAKGRAACGAKTPRSWFLKDPKNNPLPIHRGPHRHPRPVQHMGIDHRRRHIAVPQQLLHRADIRPPFQKMGGKRMPQRMTAHLLGDPRLP